MFSLGNRIGIAREKHRLKSKKILKKPSSASFRTKDLKYVSDWLVLHGLIYHGEKDAVCEVPRSALAKRTA